MRVRGIVYQLVPSDVPGEHGEQYEERGTEESRWRIVKTLLSGFKTLSFSWNFLKSCACSRRTAVTSSTELQSLRRSARVCLAKSMPLRCFLFTKAASKRSRQREEHDGSDLKEVGR